jgi:hypothetical protein
MNTAKKAASSPSIIEDEATFVEKVAENIHPEREDARAMPAYASEAPNGEPSQGPSEELGMTAVVDPTVLPQEEAEQTVRMVNADGVELDVDAADVKIHERSGWKRLKEEEA